MFDNLRVISIPLSNDINNKIKKVYLLLIFIFSVFNAFADSKGRYMVNDRRFGCIYSFQ